MIQWKWKEGQVVWRDMILFYCYINVWLNSVVVLNFSEVSFYFSCVRYKRLKDCLMS